MEEIGVVKSTDGISAIVVVARKSACEQCTAGCRISDSGAEIEAINEARAKVGQRVRVNLKPFTYLKGTVMVYGVPAVALIAGAVFGKEVLSRLLPASDPDILSAVSGFGAFLATFFSVNRFSKRMGKKADYQPVIEEVLETEPPHPESPAL